MADIGLLLQNTLLPRHLPSARNSRIDLRAQRGERPSDGKEREDKARCAMAELRES